MNNQKMVLGFLFSEDKKNILVIKKLFPEWQKEKLNGVGGKIELGENPQDTMNRECNEELEIDVIWKKYMVIIDNDNILTLFRAFSDEIFKTKSFNDVGEEIWILDTYRFNNLRKECMYNLHWMVDMALDDTIKIGIIKTTTLVKIVDIYK